MCMSGRTRVVVTCILFIEAISTGRLAVFFAAGLKSLRDDPTGRGAWAERYPPTAVMRVINETPRVGFNGELVTSFSRRYTAL